MSNTMDTSENRGFDSRPRLTLVDGQQCREIVGDEAAQNIVEFANRRVRALTPEDIEKEIATEGGHWYLPDGRPFYTVPYKSGPKKGQERPVSLRWDRKLMVELGAVPSVTTVAKILDKPGLNEYKLKRIFEAAVTIELKPGEDMASFYRRCKEWCEREGRVSADKGTELHGEVERFLLGQPLKYGDKWKPHVENIDLTLCQYGINLRDGSPEHSFAHDLGFGGKVDWHDRGTYPDGAGSPAEHDELPIVLDFKSKSKDEVEDAIKGKQIGYFESHCVQLAAYREGLQIPNARCANVFVDTNTAKVFIHEWPEKDLQRGWGVFQHLLQVWQGIKEYSPGNNNNGKEAQQ